MVFFTNQPTYCVWVCIYVVANWMDGCIQTEQFKLPNDTRNWWVICALTIVKNSNCTKIFVISTPKILFSNLNYFLFSSKIVSLECSWVEITIYILWNSFLLSLISLQLYIIWQQKIVLLFPFYFFSVLYFFCSSSNKHKYTLDHSRNFSVSG